MQCVDRPAPFTREQTDPDEPCDWPAIISAIRARADRQPREAADDLQRWADLLQGVAELARGA